MPNLTAVKWIVTTAFCANHYADGPAFAAIPVDQALVDQVRGMQANVAASGLNETRIEFERTVWSDSIHFPLENDQLVVRREDFWVAAFPRRGGANMETAIIDVGVLERLTDEDGPILFNGFSPDDLSDSLHSELAGLLGEISEAPTSSGQEPTKEAPAVTRRLVIEAYCTNEFGEGPGFAVVTIDRAFVDLVKKHQAIVVANDGLYFSSSCGIVWENKPDYRIRSESLSVGSSEFFFTGQPKHVDYEVVTRPVEIEELEGYLASDLEFYVVGDAPDDLLDRALPLLRALYLEDLK